jgi:SAM-dependent methyltransferase
LEKDRIGEKMDQIFTQNRDRWNALAQANIEYSKPFLEFTQTDAEAYIYRYGILPDVSSKKVLCLASGGGQDSVAFGLLGAQVTVVDLSDVQLERDRQGAAHHNLNIETIQGDMRDLSFLPKNQFDLVWQAYSINFIPDVAQVIKEVSRVLKPGGYYYLQFANPFVMSVADEGWNGKAYSLLHNYLDGEDLTIYYPHWDVALPDGTQVKLDSPHEFRHTLSTVLNTQVHYGFRLLHLQEWMKTDQNPEPGSWAHFTQIAPPWFDSLWQLEK